MRMLDANMQQCYTKAGLSPSMFGSNETEIKGAIIGKDKEAASRFCGWVASICQDGVKFDIGMVGERDRETDITKQTK